MIDRFVDGFERWDDVPATAANPLAWPGYEDLLRTATTDAGIDESVVTGRATVTTHDGRHLPVGVVTLVFEFIGGSMGVVAGERIVAAYERAQRERLPVFLLTRTGGARLQEGMLALLQMARVVDAARRHAEAGLLQIAYLESPTTGGVYASAVGMADIVWAAPDALLGFAGPRVVAVTLGTSGSDQGQRAEAAFAAGLVDALYEPADGRAALATAIDAVTADSFVDGPEVDRGTSHLDAFADAWAAVQTARDVRRPSGRTWVERLVSSRIELRGDRAGGTDDVVLTGLGHCCGRAVGYVALDRHTGDGRPRAAGYRMARRLFALTARLGLPLVTFVDTPGADPTDAAVAYEIARTMAALASHPQPTVSLVVGEGGSGGALALAATDRRYLLEGSIFSVIAPEGAAAILHHDPARAPEVAPHLCLTGPELLELGVIDGIVVDTNSQAALCGALTHAAAGEGRARLDSTTRRWLHPR